MSLAAPDSADGTFRMLRACSPRQRRRWLSTFTPSAAADQVRRLADLVTATTRVDLSEAEALARLLACFAVLVRDASVRARASRAQGHGAALRGRYRIALNHYRDAIRGFSRAHEPVEQAVTRSGALQTLMYLGQYQQATRWATAARRVFELHRDRLRLARLDANVGNILQRRDRFDDARQCYQRALDVFTADGHAHDEALALRNLATCYNSLNQLGPALDTYVRSRTCASNLGLTRIVAAIDYNVAYLHYLRGDYDRALALYDAARAQSEAVRDRYHAALCDLDQAELALDLNLIREAEAFAASAGRRFRQLGLRYERAKASVHRGLAEQRRGEWLAATRHLLHARTLFTREHNTVWLTLIDLYLAVILVEHGRAREGERRGRAVLRRLHRSPMQDRIAFAHYVQARAFVELGRVDLARRHCRHALESLSRHPVPALACRVWQLLGQLEIGAGRPGRARSALERSHQQVEMIREQLGNDGHKVALLIDKLPIYQGLVRLALDAPKPDLARAFRFMEQAKARTLADQMAIGPSAARADLTLKAHAGDLAATYREREALSRGRRSESTRRLDIERRIRRLALGAKKGARSSHARLEEAPDDLSSLQASLSPETRVVEYFVTNGQLLAWVVGPGEASVHELGPEREVERTLQALHLQFARCRWSDGRRVTADVALEHLDALGHQLLEPLNAKLSGAMHLVVVPHGTLHAVPWPAICAVYKRLGDHVTVSVAPSAAAYRRSLRPVRDGQTTALLVGVPDAYAPLMGAEVRQVAARFAAPTVAIGAQATLQFFTREAGRARLLHVAAHGEFRADNPEYSSIQLADGRITLRDLHALQIDADLVTLSGCGTGRHMIEGGDELVGLSRGLMQAGARSVLASLWDVSDTAAALFMEAFYENLQRGRCRASACRNAAAFVRGEHPHPYYWAPFVLVGHHVVLDVPPVFWSGVEHP